MTGPTRTSLGSMRYAVSPHKGARLHGHNSQVEVLCQQLKGRGTYTIPPTMLTTSSSKSSGSMLFQLTDPAQKSSIQAMDQLLLNSSLNLLDDLPRLQSRVTKDQCHMNKQHHKFLHLEVTTPYRPHHVSTKQPWISTKGHNPLRFCPG